MKAYGTEFSRAGNKWQPISSLPTPYQRNGYQNNNHREDRASPQSNNNILEDTNQSIVTTAPTRPISLPSIRDAFPNQLGNFTSNNNNNANNSAGLSLISLSLASSIARNNNLRKSNASFEFKKLSVCKLPSCSELSLQQHHGGYCPMHFSSTSSTNQDTSPPPSASSKRNKKYCRISTCDKLATAYGYCTPHSVVKNCKVEGCTKRSQIGGKCFKHGGGKSCLLCNKRATKRGYCSVHSEREYCIEIDKTTGEQCRRLARRRHRCQHHMKQFKNTIATTTGNRSNNNVANNTSTTTTTVPEIS